MSIQDNTTGSFGLSSMQVNSSPTLYDHAWQKLESVKKHLLDSPNLNWETLKKVGGMTACGFLAGMTAYTAFQTSPPSALITLAAAITGAKAYHWATTHHENTGPNLDTRVVDLTVEMNESIFSETDFAVITLPEMIQDSSLPVSDERTDGFAMENAESILPQINEMEPSDLAADLKIDATNLSRLQDSYEPLMPVENGEEVSPFSFEPSPLESPLSPTQIPVAAPTPQSRNRFSNFKTQLIKLAFRIGAIFKAIVLVIISLNLFIAGTAIVWFPPTKKLGLELWVNGTLALKLLKETMIENFVRDPFFNSSQLLKNDQGTFQSEFSWYLNLGLMRQAYEKTEDPKLKEQIQFIAANYLAKAAPYNTHLLRFLNSNFDLLNQIPARRSALYHRTSCREQIKLTKKFNDQLSLVQESPLILTDTSEISDLFKLGFIPFATSHDDWEESIKRGFANHFALNGAAPFSSPMSALLDATSLMQECIQDPTKTKQTQDALKQIRSKLKRIALQIAAENPTLKSTEIYRFIQSNLACISMVNLGEIAGIKVLPIEPTVSGSKLINQQAKLFDFISSTGLYLNRISFYRHLVKDEVFQTTNTTYAVDGPENIHYFKQIADLTRNIVEFDLEEKEYVQVLGNATIKLLKGWVQEVGQERWEELNKIPALRGILDNTLYKIKLQIAEAQLYKNEFNRFNQSIELIHNELAILLELTKPFQPTDFSSIYQDALQIVPPELKPFVKASVAKTAMNVYTAIESALTKITEPENRTPVRAYCPNLYYESVGFMGTSHPIEEATSNQTIAHIDHYSTQFNSNIRVESAHTNYEITDVVGDIRKLLDARPNTTQLTVSVDCTIDYFNSTKVAALLLEFEQEVKEGKINFVFFRSGQKFEMLGMDNYYGAPYFIVNNGQDHWDSFNQAMSASAFKTDTLSMQWFCLSNRYASDAMDSYRNTIFNNSRDILNQISESMRPRTDLSSQRIRVNGVEISMDPAFIDIKISGAGHRLRSKVMMGAFLHHCVKRGIKIDSRASFGFSHPNITNISVDEDISTSLRITPGINREENQVIIEFLNSLTKYS